MRAALTELGLTVDGEPVDAGFEPPEEHVRAFVEVARWRDTVTRADADGRPLAVIRSFGDVERTETEGVERVELTRELVGRSLELELEGEEVVAKVADRGGEITPNGVEVVWTFTIKGPLSGRLSCAPQ